MTTNFIYSVPVTKKKDGETAIFRNPDAKDHLMDPKVKTMQDLWERTAKENSKRPCLQNLTYEEVDKLATSVGSWMASKGFDLVYIHSRNRVEWTIIDIACWKYGVINVPLYDTLGKVALEHTLKLTEGKLIFSSKESVESLIKIKPTTLNVVKQMILLDDITKEQQAQIQKMGIKVLSYKNILNEKVMKPRKVKPSDPLTYAFTSGTTGVPKGAILTHENMANQTPATMKLIGLNKDDIHFSYLPLPHVYQRTVQSMILVCGASIGYGSGNIANFIKDLQRVRPTFLPVVPRIFTMLYDIIRPFSHVDKQLAAKAFKAKKENFEKGIKKSEYDEVVFKKPNDLFGGRLRRIVTGSAPIAPQILTFFRIVLDAKIFQGYGQTETTAITFVCNPDDNSVGHVGGPSELLEFKLVDIPEMKYFSYNNPPTGEICVRGSSVFTGYYKDKVNTEETIDKDGWHHSGDVGALMPNGAVKIIDRKKNIYKLSQGEYIAPEKIENVYKQNPVVSDLFLYGDSLRNFNVAIVVPNKDVLAQHGITGSMEEICKNPKAAEVTAKLLEATGKEGALHGFEQAKKVHLFPQPFATTGIVTNTMKLQRHEAKEFFKDIIENLYKTE